MPTVNKNSKEVKENIIPVDIENQNTDLRNEVDNLKNQIAELMSLMTNKNTDVTNNIETVVGNNENVRIVSLYDGVLNLFDGISTLKFSKFGDSKIITKSVVANYFNHNTEFAEKGYFYIECPELIKNYNYIDLYNRLLDKAAFDNIMKYPESKIYELVGNAPEEQRQILCDMIIRKLCDGEQIDLSKVTMIDTACGNTGDNTILARREQLRLIRESIIDNAPNT